MACISSSLSHENQLLIHQYREYLEHRHLAKRTVKEYPDAIARFLAYLHDLKVNVRETGLKEAQGYLYEAVNQSVSTQRGKVALLRNFFRFLHKIGRIYIDPTVSLAAPRLPKRLPRHLLEVREVEGILNQPDLSTFNGVRDRAMLELLYSSGLRNAEIRELDVEDIDLGESRVRVMGKGGKEAYVPFGRKAHKALEHYLKFWRPRLKAKIRKAFISQNYRQGLSGRALSDLVAKYARMAGLTKPCTPHSFRHSCATHLLRNGADIRLIQELLRHGDLTSTQVYTRVDIRDLKEAQRKFHPRERDDDGSG